MSARRALDAGSDKLRPSSIRFYIAAVVVIWTAFDLWWPNFRIVSPWCEQQVGSELMLVENFR